MKVDFGAWYESDLECSVVKGKNPLPTSDNGTGTHDSKYTWGEVVRIWHDLRVDGDFDVHYCISDNEDFSGYLPINRYFIASIECLGTPGRRRRIELEIERRGLSILGTFLLLDSVESGDYFFAWEISESDARKLGWIED